MPPETKRLTLQQFNSTYFGQLFVIYCNKICELIADTYKIFKTVNCLLQQYVYIYIYIIASKLPLKYLEFIATKVFVVQTYYLKFYYNISYQLLK